MGLTGAHRGSSLSETDELDLAGCSLLTGYRDGIKDVVDIRKSDAENRIYLSSEVGMAEIR
jgi:hypothetical protein